MVTDREMLLLAQLDNARDIAQARLAPQAPLGGDVDRMTVDQICKRLNITRAWLFELQRQGKIAPVAVEVVTRQVVRTQDYRVNVYDAADVERLAGELTTKAKAYSAKRKGANNVD